MRDSGAWKPLLLLPALAVGIIIERGIIPLVPLWLVAVLVFFCLILFFRRIVPRSYQRPRARFLSVDKIEVTGDVEHMERRFNEMTNPASFVKMGDRHWIIEMPNLRQTDQTKSIVDWINNE